MNQQPDFLNSRTQLRYRCALASTASGKNSEIALENDVHQPDVTREVNSSAFEDQWLTTPHAKSSPSFDTIPKAIESFAA